MNAAMNNLTYRELRDFLNEQDDETLNMNVSVYMVVEDEVVPVESLNVTGQEESESVSPLGILDPDHPYLIICAD